MQIRTCRVESCADPHLAAVQTRLCYISGPKINLPLKCLAPRLKGATRCHADHAETVTGRVISTATIATRDCSSAFRDVAVLESQCEAVRFFLQVDGVVSKKGKRAASIVRQ